MCGCAGDGCLVEECLGEPALTVPLSTAHLHGYSYVRNHQEECSLGKAFDKQQYEVLGKSK